jgi:hypothetical protein
MGHLPPLRRPPRQAMTARESNAFNEMFEMIFNAVDAHEKSTKDAPSSAYDPSIGVGRGGVDDLIGRLQKFPRRLKLTKTTDEALDRQIELMNNFESDQALLEWATKEIFGESQRFEEEARKAMSSSKSNTKSMTELPLLQPAHYPQLLSHLMKLFREKFGDPHLTLAMFNHARRLSIASYVFGCTTQVYNEIIQTYWECFSDLQSVLQTLEEMKTNAVKVDSHTRKLIDAIRRDIAEQSLQIDSEEGSETWDLLAKIEEHTFLQSSQRQTLTAKKQKPNWDFWKTSPLQDMEGDQWGFNQWGEDKFPTKKQAQEGKEHLF